MNRGLDTSLVPHDGSTTDKERPMNRGLDTSLVPHDGSTTDRERDR